MKILVASDLPDLAVEQLRALGTDVQVAPALAAGELRRALAGIGILVVDGRRVQPDAITSSDALQLIVHAGPGSGNIAVDAASTAGILVSHCPNQHASAVAEHAFALILSLDRRVVESTLAMREGRWSRRALMDARGLAGRTLGLLGTDTAGRAIAKRARAFGMKVLGWSPSLTGETPSVADIEFCNWPRELARRSDIIVVNLPAEANEQGPIVDAEFLQNARAGACIVLLGHGSSVDESALAQAAVERNLRVAADTFASEPTCDVARFRSRLADVPGVVTTQHVAAETEQSRLAIAGEVVRVIRSFVVSGEIVNCLNLAERSPARWQLVVRARDAVGLMASILDAVRADGINVEEISSRVFLGAQAAWCTIALDERPSTDALEAIRNVPDVLYLELRAVI